MLSSLRGGTKLWKSLQQNFTEKCHRNIGNIRAETHQMRWDDSDSRNVRKAIKNASSTKAIKEDRTVLVGSGKAVAISQLRDAQRYAREIKISNYSHLIVSEPVRDLCQIVQEHGMFTLIIKLSDETLSCTCPRTCSILKTSFCVITSAYTTSYEVPSNLSPMHKDSVYLLINQKTKTSTSRCIFILLWKEKVWYRHDRE